VVYSIDNRIYNGLQDIHSDNVMSSLYIVTELCLARSSA